MNDLERSIMSAVQNFTNELIAAVNGASFQELASLGLDGAPPAARVRRSAARIEEQLHAVVALVREMNSARSEDLRDHLGYSREEMPAILQLGLTRGLLAKTGVARSTEYFLPSLKLETPVVSKPSVASEPTQKTVVTPPKTSPKKRATLFDGYEPLMLRLLRRDPGIQAPTMLDHLYKQGFKGKVSIVRAWLHRTRAQHQEVGR